MSYADIIKRKQKEWKCDKLVNAVTKIKGKKIPFTSPLFNWATYGGIPRDRLSEIYGDFGSGKAQPLYSNVLTPTGFKHMGDIQVGDEVFDGAGNICHVTAVYPQGVRPIYEIVTQGHNRIRVADNHLNSVWYYNGRTHKREDYVLTTMELIEKFKKMNSYAFSRKLRVDIPSVNWEHKDVPIHPYLLGALIGDGNISCSLGFTNSEPDVCSKVNELLGLYGCELYALPRSAYDFCIRTQKDKFVPEQRMGLKATLDALGLRCTSAEKFIPEIYLLNDYETRIQLLQGLMDTDGHIGKKNGNVEFSTSSPKLSKDFSFLVQSLGIRDTVTERESHYRGANGETRICKNSFRHLLKIPKDVQFFTSEKHKSRFRIRQNEPLRNIVSIDYIGDEACQCIMVDSPLHTYISDDFIPTHNTTTVLDLCKNASKLFKQEYDERLAELQQKLSDGDKNAEDIIDEMEEVGPKKVVYFDIENAFDISWAGTLGLNFEGDDADIDVIQPPNVIAEDILQTIREIIETGEIGLIVMDSIAALTPKAMLGKEIGERTVAALSGLLATFCPIVTPLLTRYGCTLVMVNQIRDNMNNPFVVNTPGGKSPKFYASFRAQFRKGKFVDFLGNDLPNNTENPSGCIIEMQITKQKTAPNDRRLGTYYLMFDSGIRPDYDYAALALKNYSLIRKSGGWYSFVSPSTGEVLTDNADKPIKVNGMANVYSFLNSNQEYYKELTEYIMNDINGKSEVSDESEEA